MNSCHRGHAPLMTQRGSQDYITAIVAPLPTPPPPSESYASLRFNTTRGVSRIFRFLTACKLGREHKNGGGGGERREEKVMTSLSSPLPLLRFYALVPIFSPSKSEKRTKLDGKACYVGYRYFVANIQIKVSEHYVVAVAFLFNMLMKRVKVPS